MNEIQKMYNDWINTPADCRCVIVGSPSKEALELATDIKIICENAQWGVLDFLTVYPNLEAQPIGIRAEICKHIQYSRTAANVVLHLDPADIPLHILLGYYIASSVPIITFKQSLPVLWQFAELYKCDGSASFKYFIDQYILYQAPTTLQRLRQAAMRAR